MSERRTPEEIQTHSMEASENVPVDRILELAREIEPALAQIRNEIHKDPELGGEEFRTAARVKKYLESIGVEIVGEKIGGAGLGTRSGKEGAGIVAIVRGKKDGPTVALRADMDALPVQEPEDHQPCSQNKGIMHACGHDVHTTGLLGSAHILKSLADEGELDGNVVFLFQPSEEKTHQKESGATRMVKFLHESGLRDTIGAFVGLHVHGEMPRGSINVKEGLFLASSGEVDIKLKGQGGHIMSAYKLPNLNRIFSEITVKLSDIFEPLAKKEEALVASGRTQYSGAGYNVLPAEAESTWVVRVASPMYRSISNEILAQIKSTVEGVVASHAPKDTVSVEITKRTGYRPVVHRDNSLVETASQASEQVLQSRAGNFERRQEMFMGGEDFSFYLERFKGKEIPGVFIMVGATPENKAGAPHHSPNFEVDERAVGDLAALHAAIALNTMKELSSR